MNLEDVLAFATSAHREQTRKYSGEPYIVHPEEVMALLIQYVPHVTEPMLAAALLHDTVEDTSVTVYEIGRHFGKEVALLVDDLTERERVGNRKFRKAEERARLSQVSANAQTIKYADLLSNLRDIVAQDPNFAKVYLEEARQLVMVMDRGYAPLRGTLWLAIIGAQNAR